MMVAVKPETLSTLVGREIGVSDWLDVSQARIDTFADCTEDHQFIHIDPARARAETPFGGTIAHGFLTLSLLSRLAAPLAVALEGATMGINYGFDRIRFLHPVPAGSRIRGRFELDSANQRKPGQWMLVYRVTVEIEGVEAPALQAQWLTLQIVEPNKALSA